jgi:hypothetical protein
MLVFGGGAFAGVLNDTWILDWGARDRQVVIDVAPGKEPKRINRNSNAELKVAVLSDPPRCSGDPGFDGASPHLPGVGTPNLKERDVNGDGYPDVVVLFKVSQLDVDPSSRPVFLDGETYDGMNIRGKGRVHLVPPKDTGGTSRHLSIVDQVQQLVDLPYLALDRPPVIRPGSTLKLSFLVGTVGAVSVELYDVRGRRISSLSTPPLLPGVHQTELKLQRSIVPGVYFARVTQNGQSVSSKIIIIRR